MSLEVGSTEYKSIAVLYCGTFFSTDTGTHGTFSKMIPKYWYRGTFSKKIWYFQFFVITNGLKIKVSLSL